MNAETLDASKRLGVPTRRRTRPLILKLGNLLLGLGFLLSFLGATYYVYSIRAQAELNRLVQRPEPTPETINLTSHGVASSLEREMTADLADNLWTALPISREAPSPLSVFTDPVISGLAPGRLPFATQILIPSIGLDSPVVELGTKYKDGSLVWESANKAVGHHLGSANPGEAGNIVMSGHISHPTEGSVFKKLPEVRLGDEVILQTSRGEFRYKVVETKVVLPTEVSVMNQTVDPQLTLITCVPDWVYTHRLIVIAKPTVGP